MAHRGSRFHGPRSGGGDRRPSRPAQAGGLWVGQRRRDLFSACRQLAATWDPELAAEIGAAIGREAIAQRVGVVLGPGANIKRHPLCGRNFEYFSEDPLLSGVMAAAMVLGIQSVGIGTSVKHFAANNQEAGRMVVDTLVDERTLREIYLPAFERVVRTAQPWTIMCAFPRINGDYCAENEWLLTTVLREDWGFEGVVLTDWVATNDRVRGLAAGLDLEMPGSGGMNDALIVEAVEAGLLDEAAVDQAVGRVIDLLTRCNETLGPEPTVPATLDLHAHHRLARRAAAASAVLLANDGILPLAPSGAIAVIGDFAVTPRYQGGGSSTVAPTRIDSLFDAIADHVGDNGVVSFARGYDADADRIEPYLIEEAVEVARSASVVILSVGLPAGYESEAYDRPHMRMPPQHGELIEAVTAANPNTVVVLSNGSPVEMPWVDRPRAILEAYLGGQGSGHGAAQVLFGEVNPSGKLAETFPIRAADHGSDPYFGGPSRQVQYREGVYVGYRWFETVGLDVLFPFGHGLSYTTFGYDEVDLSPSDLSADADDLSVTVSVSITNTGDRSGAEVVQVYVRPVGSTIARPDRELKGFARVQLDPGSTSEVSVVLDRRAFAFWDVTQQGWHAEPGDFEILVGSSSQDIRAAATATLRGTPSAAVGAVPPSVATLADDDVFAALLCRAIPEPDAVRPFHRNSTLGEVAQVPLGAMIRKAVLKLLPRMVAGGDPKELDESTLSILESIVDEMSLRSMALLSAGRISWQSLDRLVFVLNCWPERLSRPRRAVRRA